jgi:hypothetical protein
MKKALLLLLSFYLSLFTLHAQSWFWGVDGTSDSDTRATATDSKGNAYLAGGFGDTISFGSNHLTATGLSSSYIVKYDTMGNVTWVATPKPTGLLSYAVIYGVATYSYKSVYAAGKYRDTVAFGGDTLRDATAIIDMFVAKYNSSGNEVWARHATYPSRFSDGEAYAVATDRYGNVFVTGDFYDTITFGAYTLRSGHNNIFLVKYDSNGNVLWAEQSVTPSYSSYCNYPTICTDNAGSVYLTAELKDSISFGPYLLPGYAGGYSEILVKYDSSGNVLWANHSVAASYFSSCTGSSVSSDKAGYIYQTGYFQDTISIGAYTIYSIYESYTYLAKYNTNGKVVWVKQGGMSGNAGYCVATDSLYNIYLSGQAQAVSGSISFGGDTLTYTNDADGAYIMKMDSSGKVMCGSVIRSGGDDFNNVSVDPSGKHIYLGGDIDASILFGSDSLKVSIAAGEPPFIARWQPCTHSDEGISELKASGEEVRVYPNPSKGVYAVEIRNYESTWPVDRLGIRSRVEVYNVLGEQIYSNTFSIQNSKFNIDLTAHPAGIYLYRIISEDGSLVGSGKLIKE